LNVPNSANVKNSPMLEKIAGSKEGLYQCIQALKEFQSKYSNLSMSFVVTHGDPHHCNVLQTDLEVFLIEWEL